MQSLTQIANILKVISNPNRLKILCVLGKKSSTVSEIHKEVNDITMAALSQHLATLRLANIISCEKKGMFMYYSISDEKIMKIIETLKKEYCS